MIANPSFVRNTGQILCLPAQIVGIGSLVMPRLGVEIVKPTLQVKQYFVE